MHGSPSKNEVDKLLENATKSGSIGRFISIEELKEEENAEEHDILPRWKKRKQSLSAEKLKSVKSSKLEMYIPDLPVNIKIERIKMTDEKNAEKRSSPRITKYGSKFAN